jgi:hypothetical protein
MQGIAGTGWPAPPVPYYIEDYFSTYLYTGNGSTQTITNGINLSTNGGLVWFKPRDTANNHNLIDSARGLNKFLITNATSAEGTASAGYGVSSFNSTGFSLAPPWTSSTNTTSTNYVSWTFAKQPKFFDIVTYTGDGSTSTRSIAHNLGSAPRVIIIKRTDTTSDWKFVYLGTGAVLRLNETDASNTSANLTGGYPAGSSATYFEVVAYTGNVSAVNASGGTYVAYLFAHNAGGFGLTGTDNVISCGSFTTDGSGNATVNLGYEPQWILYKNTSSAEDWFIRDNMRGWSKGTNAFLRPNLSDTEYVTNGNYTSPNATGFEAGPTFGAFSASSTYIYIAIRRGPMKVPTNATKVFLPYTFVTPSSQDTGTAVDSVLEIDVQTANVALWGNRLTGSPTLDPRSTNAQTTGFGPAFTQGSGTSYTPANIFGEKAVSYGLSRAPRFFDVVCYTGTGGAATQSHNLGVIPELIIIKDTLNVQSWAVGTQFAASTNTNGLLDQAAACNISQAYGAYFSAQPTSALFSLGTHARVNAYGDTYVAYLFATCAGVSKVGSYTGTGTLTTINCGFSGGARFVLIKRTDSTGDWYVWDTARGMVAGTDPSLSLNTTAAESNANSVYTIATGFQLLASPSADVNTNGGTYIYLAIA